MNQYIPEYNPTKYLKAKKISLVVSIISIILFVILTIIQVFISTGILFTIMEETYTEWIVIGILLITVPLLVCSVLCLCLAIKFNKQNKMFSEPDPIKRMEMYKRLVEEAESAARKID